MREKREIREKEKKRGRFLKRSYAASCAKNFQPLRAKRATKPTMAATAINKALSLIRVERKIKQKTCECASKAPPQSKCSNQASNGSSAVALAGGMFKNLRFLNPSVCAMAHTSSRGIIYYNGAGSPLAQNLSISQKIAEISPICGNTIKAGGNGLWFCEINYLQYRGGYDII